MQPITKSWPHEYASRGILRGWKRGQRCPAFLVKEKPGNRGSVRRSELFTAVLDTTITRGTAECFVSICVLQNHL
jgi:hypothetical protein